MPPGGTGTTGPPVVDVGNDEEMSTMRSATLPRLRLLALPMALAVMLTACGADEPDTGESAGDEDGEEQAQEEGEQDGDEDADAPADEAELDSDATLRVAWSTLPNQLDPHMAALEVSEFRAPLALVYDRLFTVTPEVEVEGMLVEEWGYSDDGLTLTLELRDDVEFRDGTPLDAEVVASNLERARELESPAVQSRMAPVEGVDAVADYTVELALASPTPEIPWVLSQNAGLIMHPELLEDGEPAEEVRGSGPYVIDSFTPGEEVTVVRDIDHGYWDEDAAKLARIEMVRIADPSALTGAMQGGQVDLAQFFPFTVGAMEDEEGFKIEHFPMESSLEIFINRTWEGLDDRQVRQAINHAIDREAIVESLFPGSDPKWQFFRNGLPGSDPELEGVYPYDPEAARELLAEAGYADGLDLGGMPVTQAAAPGLGEVIQEQLAEVGITVQPESTDSAEIYSIWPQGEHALKINFGGSGMEPGSSLNNRFRPGLLIDETTSEYDELLAEASSNLLDEDERNARYAEVNRHVVEEAWVAPLVWINWPYVMDERVVNFTVDTVDYGTMPGPFDFRYVGMLEE